MFDPSDPRASLAAAPVAKPVGPFAPEQAGDFSQMPPVETGDGYTVHYWRATNLLLAVVQLDGTFTIERPAQTDEFAILTLDPIMLDLTANGEHLTSAGNSLTIMPPGACRMSATGTGTISLLFSPRNQDIAAKCPNNAAFDARDPRIPSFQQWPDPTDGFRLRCYDLDIPAQEGRFGRIFRCTTMMINVLDPRMGLRDPSKVSPHHHDDFEQVSLCLKGGFRHMMRWPWTPNMAHWRGDVGVEVGCPSACVIPPPTIHTSLSTTEGENQLIDLFAPPRLDFSLKSGWVLNADDYPLPAHVKG